LIARRTYVLDTSVLLADPRAILRFQEQDVILPLVVISELEGKRHHLSWSLRRQALRILMICGPAAARPADRRQRRWRTARVESPRRSAIGRLP
jgi:predicted nucleic acid-binding protein